MPQRYPTIKNIMITSLYLEGFKSFGKPVTIDFRDITLLYGENSSGKSTILQALQYAREVFCNGNLDCLKTEIGGDFVDLRGFDSFVSNRRNNGLVTIAVSISVENEQHWYKDLAIICQNSWPFVDELTSRLPFREGLAASLRSLYGIKTSSIESRQFLLPTGPQDLNKHTVKIQVSIGTTDDKER